MVALDWRRSRYVQIVVGIVGVILLYRFFFRSNDTYTNEELNTILQGDEYSDANEFNINKKPFKSLELHPPFLTSGDVAIENYSYQGNTMISGNKIRLINDKPHQVGVLFSENTIPSGNSFQLELEFNINGAQLKNGMYGDGMVVWITDAPLLLGDVFGVQNKWNGLGLFLDTYQNNHDKSRRHIGFPYASLQINDGKQGYYDKDSDGFKTELAGCSLSRVHNVRGGKSKMRLVYLKESGYLSVDFDIRANGNWRNCFTIDKDIKLPLLPYVGFSGETGDLSHNVDLYKFDIYGLYDDEDAPIRSIKLINEDLKHHLKEEKNDVVLSKLRTKALKRQMKAKNQQSRRRTLSRLHKLEKRLKLQIAADNVAKYGHESFLSYVWSLIKSICFWIMVLVGIYGISIFLRAYFDRKRVQKGNYYKGGLL